jgi:hypothetical protein
MHLTWHFGAGDIAALRNIVAAHEGSALLHDRRSRNLSAVKSAVSRERFWRALCMGLLTTQQPSGPSSSVARLLATQPFPLAHTELLRAQDPEAHATQLLVRYRGIRRHGRIGSELAENLSLLEGGEWLPLLSALGKLAAPVDAMVERDVADYLDDRFKGLGPKQARNVLQALGLTRYEIPLDSRLAKWLRSVSFPVPVGASALADRAYYCFVLDALHRLCQEADIFPCELDAAVFASYDADEWTPQLVVF